MRIRRWKRPASWRRSLALRLRRLHHRYSVVRAGSLELQLQQEARSSTRRMRSRYPRAQPLSLVRRRQRLQPATAAQVHALGLKFGIHVMRGIPRLAVEQNPPVLNTHLRAQDVADTSSICSWNPDMYGVDMWKSGAQAYYDSLFASLRVVGCRLRQDGRYEPALRRARRRDRGFAHNAIRASGRPIVLSLSPGETPVSRGDQREPFRPALADQRRLLGRMADAGRTVHAPRKTGTPIVVPARGPIPTCCRLVASRSARAIRASRRMSSVR